jgi:hypothetical protein
VYAAMDVQSQLDDIVDTLRDDKDNKDDDDNKALAVEWEDRVEQEIAEAAGNNEDLASVYDALKELHKEDGSEFSTPFFLQNAVY